MCLGVPGRITSIIDGFMRMGQVDFEGSSLEVCLAYVPEARPGDFVLVHAGFALAQLDEEQALATIEGLRRFAAGPEPVEQNPDQEAG
jgi:hydrogenase expression/formation protein HypC